MGEEGRIFHFNNQSYSNAEGETGRAAAVSRTVCLECRILLNGPPASISSLRERESVSPAALDPLLGTTQHTHMMHTHILIHTCTHMHTQHMHTHHAHAQHRYTLTRP